MGLDLTLMPFDSHEPPFSHSLLYCDRDSDLFDRVSDEEESSGEAVPQRFTSFRSREGPLEESHYGITTKTPYGEPLRHVRAGDLATCFADAADLSTRNAAIRAFLTHLDPTTRVALFWH